MQIQKSAVKLHSLGQYWQNRRRGSKGLTVFAWHLDMFICTNEETWISVQLTEKVGLGQICCKLEQLELGTGSNVGDQE